MVGDDVGPSFDADGLSVSSSVSDGSNVESGMTEVKDGSSIPVDPDGFGSVALRPWS